MQRLPNSHLTFHFYCAHSLSVNTLPQLPFPDISLSLCERPSVHTAVPPPFSVTICDSLGWLVDLLSLTLPSLPQARCEVYSCVCVRAVTLLSIPLHNITFMTACCSCEVQLMTVQTGATKTGPSGYLGLICPPSMCHAPARNTKNSLSPKHNCSCVVLAFTCGVGCHKLI